MRPIITIIGTLVEKAKNLRFLVFVELHTYRGRQGADVALLIRRCRMAFQAQELICVGTSATMASGGSVADQKAYLTEMWMETGSLFAGATNKSLKTDESWGQLARTLATPKTTGRAATQEARS